MKPKVLFVGAFQKTAKDGSYGGQMFACDSLVNSRLGKRVDWVLLDTTATTNRKRSFMERASKAFLRLVKFFWILLSQKVDIVLVFTSYGFSFREKGTMILIAKFFDKKTVLAPRSGLIKNDVETSASMRRFVQRIVRKTDRVVCQGPSWKTYYSKLSGSEDMHKFPVIHNWLDTDIYLKTPHKKEGKVPTRIVYLGWINRNKGIFDLLDAIKLLKDEGVQGFIVDVAGNGDALNEAIEYAKEKGLDEIVDFKNWVMGEKKIDLLCSGDLFILTSYREGYPNSLLEAMLCGLPPVTTNVGAIPDFIEDGKNGYLYTPGDVQVLKKHIRLLLENHEDRRIMGENAKATILNNNTIDKAVNGFSVVFDSLSYVSRHSNE